MAQYTNLFKIFNYGDLVRIEFQDQRASAELPIVVATVIMKGSDADQWIAKLHEMRAPGPGVQKE